MNEPKFTPGSWRLTHNNEWIVGREEDKGDVLVAQLHFESTANGHLIAAAPEMYEVLQELEESVDYWSEYDVPIGIQDRIKQVLKKARGEQV